MKRIFQIRNENRKLRKQIKDLESNNWHNIITKFFLPVATLIVILVFSILAYKTSLNAYDSSIEPQFYCNLIGDTNFYTFGLKHPICFFLLNEGVNPVYDIHIKYYVTFYDRENNTLGGALASNRDWKYFDKINPLDSIIIPIDSFFIANVLSFSSFGEKTPSIPFIIYVTTFRRKPDNRLYTKYNYGIALRYTNSKIPVLDEYGGVLFKQYEFLKPKLDSIAVGLYN
jgi:hypothetical protein